MMPCVCVLRWVDESARERGQLTWHCMNPEFKEEERSGVALRMNESMQLTVGWMVQRAFQVEIMRGSDSQTDGSV